jgi:hypothetical protein
MQRIFFPEAVFVYANDNVLAAVNTCLFSGCGFLDAQFWDSGFNGFGHAAEFFNFLNKFPRIVRDFIREAFHLVAARPRIDGFGDFGFFL